MLLRAYGSVSSRVSVYKIGGGWICVADKAVWAWGLFPPAYILAKQAELSHILRILAHVQRRGS